MTEQSWSDLLGAVEGQEPEAEAVERMLERVLSGLDGDAATDGPSGPGPSAADDESTTRGHGRPWLHGGRLRDAIDREGVEIMDLATTESPNPVRNRKLGWMLGAAAALIVAVGLALLFGPDQDGVGTDATEPSTTTVEQPATTTSASTSTSPPTTSAEQAGVPDRQPVLEHLFEATNNADVEAAMALIAQDATLDGGPVGWNGFQARREDFQLGLEFLRDVEGRLEVVSCVDDDPNMICQVQLDHVGYQALGGPADAIVEVGVKDGLITYYKLTDDTRYFQMREILIAEYTEISDAVGTVSRCVDFRFHLDVCAQLIIDNLELFRANAGS